MRRRGFTIIEILVAVALSAILIGITGASYLSVTRLVGRNEDELLVAQNARVVIDRISRDLRQSVGINDAVPTDRDQALTALEFEDGHEPEPAGPTYIRYEWEELLGQPEMGVVWRRRRYYVDPDNPGVRVPFNPILYAQGDIVAQEISGDTYIIAEQVVGLGFYGTEDLVQVDVALQVKPSAPVRHFHSAIAKRN